MSLKNKINELLINAEHENASNTSDDLFSRLVINEINDMLALQKEDEIPDNLCLFLNSLWQKIYSKQAYLKKNYNLLSKTNNLCCSILYCLRDEGSTKNTRQLITAFESLKQGIFRVLSTARETGIIVDPDSGRALEQYEIDFITNSSRQAKRYLRLIKFYHGLRDQTLTFEQ